MTAQNTCSSFPFSHNQSRMAEGTRTRSDSGVRRAVAKTVFQSSESVCVRERMAEGVRAYSSMFSPQFAANEANNSLHCVTSRHSLRLSKGFDERRMNEPTEGAIRFSQTANLNLVGTSRFRSLRRIAVGFRGSLYPKVFTSASAA